MKYKLSWVERKHIDKLNKDILECDATDETGKQVKFSIWSDFPNFESINAASEIEGNIWNKPGTTSFTLYPPKERTTGQIGGNKGGFKANMEKTMEKKEASIEKFQDNKELGIKIASTFRMAVDIVVATLANEKIIDESVIKGKITEWRKWLAEHWEDADIPF